MFTIPSPDPKRPLKCNILWVISEGCVLDIEQFYAVLSEMRDDMPIHPVKVEEKDRMPDEPEFKDNNKHKYTEIRRALLQLQKEGWPINKHVDQNGVAWYSMGKGFTEFLLNRFISDYESFLGTLDYAKRPDVQIKENLKEDPEQRLVLYTPKITTKGGKLQIPLKLVPKVLEPIKKNG